MIINNIWPGLVYLVSKYFINIIATKIGFNNALNIATAFLFPLVIFYYTKNKKYLIGSIIISLICGFMNNIDFLFICLIGPISEEIVYRGLCLKEGNKILLVIQALLFALGHNGIYYILISFILGIILGLIKNKKGITPCIIIHCVINALIFLLNLFFAI